MKEMDEQKYSRNMALSLLAGIVLGAAIMWLLLWALGYIPDKRQGDAVEAGSNSNASVEAVPGDGEEPPSESRESVPEPTATAEPVSEAAQQHVSSAESGLPQTTGPAREPGQENAGAGLRTESDQGNSSSEPVSPAAVSLGFQLNGSWGGEGGYYYQYAAAIENASGQKITDWEITVSGFDGCKVDSYWCCEVEEDDGCLEITPADFNEEIWEGSRAEGIGIIILAQEEWKLTEAYLEAETEGGRLTAVLGDSLTAPDVNGARPGDSETGQTAGQDAQEQGSQAGRRPAQGTQNQDAQGRETQSAGMISQGAKGPDIQAGDSLGGYALSEDTPVGEHGRLRVENGGLADQEGEPYQMHGVSTHGLAWFPEYVSEESFRTFRNEWDADVIRLAMYSDEYGGYSNGGDQENLKELIDKGVEYASKLGMYVIIDWHVLGEGDPNIHKEDAIAFFDEMSEKYADYGNVIYEICNEPNGGVSWKDVKKYAEEVIPVIRENDPYGIILVGTPQWSQLIGDAAADPIQDYDNIMYTMHFYAATHKEDLRENLEKALQDGVPVFVSECSICDASGNGGIDEKSARAWVELLDRYDVSYVAWAVSNKNETAALISSGCSKLSDWSDRELSDTGRWFKEQFTK